ncbi:glutamic acid-rich protein-like [Helianthus annuus]|uniref:glutamic acid-rich protein-like n=1 Tax=Helianthus annuus TaxID=4232 RepID=UPI000B904E12|nr:glutamic acid-rich protein-like [Helianthus annuus]
MAPTTGNPQACFEKRSKRNKKATDNGDKTYVPSDPETAKQPTKRRKSNASLTKKKTRSQLTKNARKSIVETIKETSASAPSIEVDVKAEQVIPILTPPTSQPIPTTPVQPTFPQRQPQSVPRSRSTPRQQQGPSNNIFDEDFLDFGNMNIDFLEDKNDKKIKDLEERVKKLEIENVQLATVLEDKLGINFEEEFNRIEIREVEARTVEKARNPAADLESSNADKRKDKNQNQPEPVSVDINQFVLVGEPYDVPYDDKEKEKMTKIEKRKGKKKKDDEKEDGDDIAIDIDDPVNYSDDNDDDDDDDMGGTGLVIEGKKTNDDDINEYLNENQNKEDATGKGEQTSDPVNDANTSGIFHRRYPTNDCS